MSDSVVKLKNPKSIIEGKIAKKIDKLAEIKSEQEKLKNEAAQLEAELLKFAQADLSNTKFKSVTYKGTHSNVMATVADNVKITYDTLLKDIFGKAYDDMVKETKKYELTAAGKRLIAGLWLGDYIKDSSVANVINSLNVDNKTRKLVAKKCKGINYQKDVDNLKTLAGLEENEAQEYAFLLNEAAVWQQFDLLMSANEADEEQQAKILDKIQAAFVVEQTTKITLEG